MRQHAPSGFTAVAARLAAHGRRVPSRVLRSRLAWPLAVTAVTLTWLLCGLPLAACRLAVLIREG